MASKIGTRGSGKGPARTFMAGTKAGRNLGRKAGMKVSGGPNHFVDAAFKRRGINAGPGGTQRP